MNKKTIIQTSLKNRLKREYNITIEEWQIMFRQQKGKCAICEVLLRKPHTDHNHKTGKVRRLVCFSCNFMLGFAKDQPAILRKAAKYLEQHI